MIRHTALARRTTAAVLLLAMLPLTRAAVPVAPAAAETPSRDPACVTSHSRSADGKIGYFRHCPYSPDMVSFRGGQFRMGDSVGNGKEYERPAHDVSLKPFAIGRYEVTRGEWQACVDAGGCEAPKLVPEATEAGARHPVAGVSWHQAKAYVAWLARRSGRPYRLPSEAEWEYAARAGSPNHFYWPLGNLEGLTCRFANALDQSAGARHADMTWFIDCDDGFSETAPVGSFAANAWGVHDVVGNVWEWVEDCWHPDYSGAPSDGRPWLDSGEGANCGKRVNRGGGWGNSHSALRLSNRDADKAGNISNGLGFRVALSIAAAAKPAAAPAP